MDMANALVTNNWGGGFQENSPSSLNQKLPFQGVYSALMGPSPQPDMAQSYPTPKYNDSDIVNKKVNDMERMIREHKELNERMMKTMSEPFA